MSGIDWDKEFGYGKYTFTIGEVRDLTISALLLGFLFSIALGTFTYRTPSDAVVNFFVALAIVAPALIFHELAHKFMAQKYDCKANYELWPSGAIMSLLFTLLTAGRVIFAALGAVMIKTSYSTRLGYKYIGLSSEEMGKIALAGPLVNIALSVIGFILLPFSRSFFVPFAQINAIIALFNLIPFPPLDGAKIFSWSRLVWLGVSISGIILFFLTPVLGVLLSIVLAVLSLVIIFILVRLFSPWHHPKIEHIY